MAWSRVRSLTCKSSWMISLSSSPSMIWSLSAFWRQSWLQKLQVLANSHSDTKKSSNDSPWRCFHCQKFRRSIVSLTCPSTCCFSAAIICAWSFFWALDNPRFSKLLRVSLEKQSWRAWTCFAAGSPLRLESDRLLGNLYLSRYPSPTWGGRLYEMCTWQMSIIWRTGSSSEFRVFSGTVMNRVSN